MSGLLALNNPKEIAEMYQMFENSLSHGEKVTINIGWQGGSIDADVIWHPELDIWSYFDPEWRINPKSYGGIFGVGAPRKGNTNSITVEINFDHRNPRKRIGGRYLKDQNNEYFVGHSGKVGGGKRGIGKKTFLDFYTAGDLQLVKWNDGTSEEIIVIGPLKDSLLPIKIAKFAHQVAEYKKEVRTGVIDKRKHSSDVIIPAFTPEFQGKKIYHREASSIESVTNHGLIVSSLKEELEKSGYPYANDPSGTQARDLYIPENGIEASVLFEVKTDLSTTSIYTAIGQLMFHGAWQTKFPRHVMVVPGQPDKKTLRILNLLNIEVLVYRFDEKGVYFSEFKQLMKKIE